MAGQRLIVIDLDRTIFDSDRFYIDICRALEQRGQMSAAQLKQALAILHDPEATPYVTDLMRQFKLTATEIADALGELEPNAYLYPDVIGFLNRMQGQQVVIMTTGVVRFQQLKFKISPALDAAIHQIIGDRNKGEYLKKQLSVADDGVALRSIASGKSFSELYLIDDRNYNLNALSGTSRVKLFHIRRPSEKAGDSELESDVKVISSLKEIQ